MDNTKKIVIGVIALVILLVGGYLILNRQQIGNGQISQGEVVARVNGEEIYSTEVESLQQTYTQYGQEISKENALEQLIDQKLLVQEAINKGYSVSSQEAEEMIEMEMAAQEKSLDDFKRLLEEDGVDYQEQLEIIKQQLAIQSYLEDEIGMEEREITDEEVDDFYQSYQEEQVGEDIPSFEELEPQIIAVLQQQKEEEIIALLIEELRVDAEIEYL